MPITRKLQKTPTLRNSKLRQTAKLNCSNCINCSKFKLKNSPLLNCSKTSYNLIILNCKNLITQKKHILLTQKKTSQAELGYFLTALCPRGTALAQEGDKPNKACGKPRRARNSSGLLQKNINLNSQDFHAKYMTKSAIAINRYLISLVSRQISRSSKYRDNEIISSSVGFNLRIPQSACQIYC